MTTLTQTCGEADTRVGRPLPRPDLGEDRSGRDPRKVQARRRRSLRRCPVTPRAARPTTRSQAAAPAPRRPARTRRARLRTGSIPRPPAASLSWARRRLSRGFPRPARPPTWPRGCSTWTRAATRPWSPAAPTAPRQSGKQVFQLHPNGYEFAKGPRGQARAPAGGRSVRTVVERTGPGHRRAPEAPASGPGEAREAPGACPRRPPGSSCRTVTSSLAATGAEALRGENACVTA